MVYRYFLYFYRPPTKLREGNFFRDVYHSVLGRGGEYVSSDDHQVSLAEGGGYVQGVGMSGGVSIPEGDVWISGGG